MAEPVEKSAEVLTKVIELLQTIEPDEQRRVLDTAEVFLKVPPKRWGREARS